MKISDSSGGEMGSLHVIEATMMDENGVREEVRSTTHVPREEMIAEALVLVEMCGC